MRWLFICAAGAVAGAAAFFGLVSTKVNILLVLAAFAILVACIEHWLRFRAYRETSRTKPTGPRVLVHSAIITLATFVAASVTFVILFVSMVAP